MARAELLQALATRTADYRAGEIAPQQLIMLIGGLASSPLVYKTRSYKK